MRYRLQVLVTAIALAVPMLTVSEVGAQITLPATGDSAADERVTEFQHRLRDLLARDGDERGGLFDEVWSLLYTNTGTVVDMEVDVEGNIVVLYQVHTFPLQFTVVKLDGAENQTPAIVWTRSSTYVEDVFDCAVDLDGNIYVGGRRPIKEGLDAGIVKLSPDGDILWRRTYGGDLHGARVETIVVGDDGVPFATASAGVNPPSVVRIDPVTGNLAWSQCIGDLCFVTNVGDDARLTVGGNGTLYVGITGFNPSITFAARLDPYTGDAIWCSEFAMQLPDRLSLNSDGAMDIDVHGNLYMVGAARGSGYRPDTGILVAFRPDGTGLIFVKEPQQEVSERFEVVTSGPDGHVYVGGSSTNGSDPDAAIVIKFDQNGQRVWTTPISDGLAGNVLPDVRETVVGLRLDRFANPYAVLRRPSSTLDRAVVTKLSGENGSQVWQDALPEPASGQGYTLPLGLLLDNGGSVYVNSWTYDSVSGFSSNMVTKYTQPLVDVPTIQTACAELSFENQSIWAPGTGHLVADQPLFSIEWNEGVDEGGTFTIPLLGEFGGQFTFLTDGIMDAGIRAEINGGSADVHLPFDVEFTIPSMNKLGPGSVVTIDVDWTPDPAARLTSCFTPTFNAGLTSYVEYSLNSRAFLRAFSEDLFNTTFLNVDRTIPQDYVPGMNLLDILAYAGSPVPGEWFSIEIPPKGLFTAEFRTPQMFAQGRYNPNTLSFGTDTRDRFFSFDVSVTEAILRPFGATANFEFEFPSDGDDGGDDDDNDENDDEDDEEEDDTSLDFGLEGNGRALQLLAGVELGARQQIDVGVVPMIRYEFSDGIPTQTIPITQDLVFTLPAKPFDGQVEIYPSVITTADFMNATDIEIFPGIEWISVEATLSAFAFGFEVLSFGPFCGLCYDWDLAEILEWLGVPNPTAVNIAMEVFSDFWQIPFDEVQLPCMRVLASTTNRPDLVATSRDALSMLIYDQTSPSQASFNVTTGGTSKMLLYGARLTPDSQAFIEHWGRLEAIPTTHINDSTLLLEVPDRFRLLPGVAKLHVRASGLDSDSIDLPIAYPRPRLDAVNPNLWAADPDLAALPISVIDGRSFAGNDTFIARRDYYIKMRDDLWSDVTDGGFAGGAAEYFPYFDFTQMPGFPAVLWGGASAGKPLPRFVQPVDNGIHNVRLADDQYDRPQNVPVVICNPGPGGGVSNELELTIAAPVPVASSVEPSGMSPTDIEYDENHFDPDDTPVASPVELRVMGPAHVPHFQGFEEPKYGNFNADSVVRFNGVDLPTKFVSSFLLEADLPPEMITLGDHAITVFTPSNGTVYFEHKRYDLDGDGVADPGSGTPELVASGGESAPLLFRVRYREPRIESVSPNRVEISSIAFDDSKLPKAQPYNVTLIGQDFRAGAVASFNGQPRDTLFVDPTRIRVKLLPEDVASIGVFPITVRNSSPDHQISGARSFEVVMPTRTVRARSIEGTGATATLPVLRP